MRNATLLFVTWCFIFICSAASAEIPAPLSFFDFEEGTGMTVNDAGPAANHGEMVGDSILWATGGIYADAAESDGCILLTGEPEYWAGGTEDDMGHVEIPYNDYLNSTTYTLSAWVQWTWPGPKYGYLFWANGPFYPTPEDPDRHVDVWWDPNAPNGIFQVLHNVDGEEVRFGTNINDCDVDPYDGDWHLVVVTLDSTTSSIYLDGELCAMEVSDLDIATNIDEDDLWLGARPGNEDGNTFLKMHGKIDRVRIWDVVLDEGQVLGLYDAEGPDGGIGTGVTQKHDTTPVTDFALQQNYPNPFNPSTTIAYQVNRRTHVEMHVFNMSGQRVTTLVNTVQNPGHYNVSFQGERLESGTYFVKMTADNVVDVIKMTLLK